MKDTKNEWNELAKEVDIQTTKQRLYDNLLFDFCGSLRDKKLLDFGCGTGEIALRSKKGGAEVKAYDLSENMRKSTSEKIGIENVYSNTLEIPNSYFDVVFSNLVVCVIKEKETERVLLIINRSLAKNGIAYIGFCNPLSFNIKESLLQKRIISGLSYTSHHTYKKIIKEGDFIITEQHRPISFYETLFVKYGFIIEDVKVSKEGQDFLIYKLKKIKNEK